MKRQYLPILLFGLLPKLKPEIQKEILLFMISCVNVIIILDGLFHRNEFIMLRFSLKWIF